MYIFPTDADKRFFLRQIKKAQKEFGFEIFAYCIMDNHYHLILKDNGRQLSAIIGIIQENYAKYYNSKYEHTGHVFEGIFKSNPIVGFISFSRLLRYIERNPLVAGMVLSLAEYRFSSYSKANDVYGLVNYEYVMNEFKEHMDMSYEEYLDCSKEDGMLCEFEVNRIGDEIAATLFCEIKTAMFDSAAYNLEELSVSQQREFIEVLKYNGLSIRQINVLTGWRKYIIIKIKCSKEYL
ncbi:MAG: transposase [Clostridia bacterium]|nr:transposase [Clostridia bacterium]